MILLKSVIFYYYLFICLYSSEFVNSDRSSEGGVSRINNEGVSKEPNNDNCFKVVNELNKCSYVKEYCTEFQEGPINYLEIYYCTFERVPAIGLITLIGFSVTFFLCIGIVASDFFCPNLDTISSLLNLSESVAGVTFLAFGNGSPDLFSTFSALKAGSGALAIGELVGAAWFITSVVVGSMAIIKSFNVIGPLLLRDLWFFTGAILVLLFIIWDGKITLLESLGLCLYYGLYVTTVLVGNWFNKQGEIKLQQFLHLNSLYGDRRGGRLDDYVDTSEDGWDTEADGLLLGNLEYTQNNTGGETTRLLSTMMPVVSNGVLDSRMPPVTPITYYKRMNFWTAHEIEDALKTLEPFDPPSLKHSRTMDSIGHLLHHQQVFRSKSYSPNRMVHSTGTISPVISLTSAEQNEQEDVIVKPVHVNRFKRDNSPSPLVIPQKDQTNPDNNQQPQHQFRSSETLEIPAIGGSSNTLLLPDIDTSNLTTSPVSDTSSDKFTLPADPTLTILLFPGTADWKNQSLYEKFMNIITLPLYLVFTLTVPVMVQTVEEELKSEISSIPGLSEFPILVTPASPSMQGSAFVMSPISITHNKYIAERQLKIVQVFFVTIFFFEVMLVQTGLVSRYLWWAPMLVGLALSYSLHVLYKKFPLMNYRVLTALIGFFQSITWISIIATSVVDILSSLGLILQISEEVIGLTVFAFGNSLGDFISNVAVARMGYPMMAISACFAGPMLNMMLGIGLSGIILIPSQGDHIRLTVSNTTLLSGFGVLATLLAFNIYLPLNKYRIGKKFGFSLIVFYCTTMLALILVTFLKFEA